MKPLNEQAQWVRAIVFLLFWVGLFFPIGLYTLFAGPTKWIASIATARNWSENSEQIAQKLIILGVILVTLVIARYVYRCFMKKNNMLCRYIIPAIVGILFSTSAYLFSFKPQTLIRISGSVATTDSKHYQSEGLTDIEFVFGSYPDQAELEQLKREQYDGVISLLSEMVVPAEPVLISEEKQHAQKAGIRLIRLPMLPWISENNGTINSIKEFIRNNRGKYYVHCYLGRDRVNIFKKVIRESGKNSRDLRKESMRRIEELKSFERGKYFKLTDSIYLTPFPTDDEFFGYILNGQIATVISLLVPENNEDTLWISREKKIMKQYEVKYLNFPIKSIDDKKAIQHLVENIKTIKKPILIHKYRSNDLIYGQLREEIPKRYPPLQKP